jgi:hypothetical protein
MIPEGVKTELGDRMITARFAHAHIRIGIEALNLVRRRGRSVKYLASRRIWKAIERAAIPVSCPGALPNPV